MKIGILGYGNLGKGVEGAIKQNPDCELTAVFTRRDPSTVKILTAGVPVYNVADVEKHKDEVDVLIICGGSATDLPKQTPEYAKYFNVIDSFDTHAKSLSTLQMLIQLQRTLSILLLSAAVGIQAFSAFHVCMLTAFFQTERIILSGERVFHRDIQTLSAALKV